MRKALGAIALLLLAACAGPPVEDEVTIEFFNDNDAVVVTAETRFTDNPINDQARRRVDSARDAALAGVDLWSIRLGRVTPEVDRVTFHRNRGALQTVTRSVRIPGDEIHRIFSDTAVTIDVSRGDGWRELAMYPGTSARATREQRRMFEEQMKAWTMAMSRYFTAVHHLYAYLDNHPERAHVVFTQLVKAMEESPDALRPEEEELLAGVREGMEEIAVRMDAQNEHADTFGETADLIFNPFPARITVRLPSEAISVEGFTKSNEDLVIEPVDLLETISQLEGRWVSPDPLTALLREEAPTATQLAEAPRRHSAMVHADEIAAAIREQLARPKSYVVRWRD